MIKYDTTEAETVAPARRRGRFLRRLGCGLLLIPWFLFLLTPCFVITLAVQQEIAITLSDAPDHTLRIWTLQERNARGLALSTSRRVDTANSLTCVIVDVRFFLWQGDAEKAGARPIHHCTCYSRPANNQSWTAAITGAEACQAAGK